MPVVTDATASLAAAVDSLSAVEPAALAGGDTIVALHRVRARLDAVITAAVAAFDAGRDWEAEGARSAASWLAVRCNLPSAVTRRVVANARDLRFMPAVEAAWRAGELSDSHVSVLAGARRHNPECFARDEDMLVDEARSLHYAPFVRMMAYWVQLADPDGAEERAARRYAKRNFHFSQGLEGCWFANGMFDPIGGSIVDRQLRLIYDELFRADWAEAKARVGDGVCPDDLARTPAQRRNDALVEMARRAGAAQPGARRPDPLFSVVIDLESLKRTCELWNGTVVTPGQLVPWLDDAWVERMVYEGASRVVDAGVRRRFFTGATRRAIQVRDRFCSNEFCDLPAEECEIDHDEPFSAGGLTTTENGKPKCGYHNRWKDKQRHRAPPPSPP